MQPLMRNVQHVAWEKGGYDWLRFPKLGVSMLGTLDAIAVESRCIAE